MPLKSSIWVLVRPGSCNLSASILTDASHKGPWKTLAPQEHISLVSPCLLGVATTILRYACNDSCTSVPQRKALLVWTLVDQASPVFSNMTHPGRLIRVGVFQFAVDAAHSSLTDHARHTLPRSLPWNKRTSRSLMWYLSDVRKSSRERFDTP